MDRSWKGWISIWFSEIALVELQYLELTPDCRCQWHIVIISQLIKVSGVRVVNELKLLKY